MYEGSSNEQTPKQENPISPIELVINSRVNTFIKEINGNRIVFQKLPTKYNSEQGLQTLTKALADFHLSTGHPIDFSSKNIITGNIERGFKPRCEYYLDFEYNAYGFANVDNVKLAQTLNKCGIISPETVTKVALHCINLAVSNQRDPLVNFPKPPALSPELTAHLNTITSTLAVPDKRVTKEVYSDAEKAGAEGIKESLKAIINTVSPKNTHPELVSALECVYNYTRAVLSNPADLPRLTKAQTPQPEIDGPVPHLSQIVDFGGMLADWESKQAATANQTDTPRPPRELSEYEREPHLQSFGSLLEQSDNPVARAAIEALQAEQAKRELTISPDSSEEFSIESGVESSSWEKPAYLTKSLSRESEKRSPVETSLLERAKDKSGWDQGKH